MNHGSNLQYELTGREASRLYVAALTYPDPEVRDAAKSLAEQNPLLKLIKPE